MTIKKATGLQILSMREVMEPGSTNCMVLSREGTCAHLIRLLNHLQLLNPVSLRLRVKRFQI